MNFKKLIVFIKWNKWILLIFIYSLMEMCQLYRYQSIKITNIIQYSPLNTLNGRDFHGMNMTLDNELHVHDASTAKRERERIPPRLNANKEILARRKKYKIVFYSPRQVRLRPVINSLVTESCSYRNCEFYSDFVLTNSSIDADAVVFQGNNIPATLPSRSNGQVYVFLNNEPPAYVQFTNLSSPPFQDFFNWTMTYRTDSDILMSYGAIISKEQNKHMFLSQLENSETLKLPVYRTIQWNEVIGLQAKNYSNIYRSKQGGISWIVSHCKTQSQRETYVEEMKKFAHIEQFGECNNKTLPWTNNLINTMSKQYKFYLAFENSLCNDYITEKVFQWFMHDIVPVVRGGCDYSKFLPTGSYIDARDFVSAKELAQYLTTLGSDENKYLAYLRTKDQYQVITEKEMVHAGLCRLCSMLNQQQQYTQTYASLHRWWNDGQCREPDGIVKRSKPKHI